MKFNQIWRKKWTLESLQSIISQFFFMWDMKISYIISSFFWDSLLTKINGFWPDWKKLSWPRFYDNHFGIWETLLYLISVNEALNRPQKGLNIVLQGKVAKPYSFLGRFWPKEMFFSIRKIMWVDCYIPMIVLVYGKTFWTIFGSLRH